MKERFANLNSRRDLFAGVLRYATLALMGAGAAGIFAKRRQLVRQGKCVGAPMCEGCEILATCELPRAVSAKEIMIGGANAR